MTLFSGAVDYSDLSDEHIGLALWAGNGDGTVSYPVAYHLLPDALFIGYYEFDEDYKRMSTADFDQDGDLDIVITSASNFLQVLLNDGAGNFSENGRVGVGQAPSNICTGDFDQDGNLDIASINQDSKELVISFGNGDGTFVEKDVAIAIDLDSDVDVFDMVVFDFNADGVPDIAFAEDGTNPSDTGRGSVQAFLSPGLSE
ncbi:hypothetical protein DSCO28_50950 [Desulfosarcina ovata subsp. sediminis]|uniref:VCBS repeat-containing protein n=1 Tax=Desulfosarcina ovata subsp. sediminis TaxID=885957 RepID=A0A5K7ZW98_9BACT|nr:hypothetical protein DSCO28_50950 [Desulfosarcina ovata subsp. sediminis]